MPLLVCYHMDHMLCAICRLYEKLSEDDQAAAAYTEYINEMSSNGVSCDLYTADYIVHSACSQVNSAWPTLCG